jgi:hypothetical protein
LRKYVSSILPLALACAALLTASACFAQTIKVTDYGVQPNSGHDATEGVNKALAAAKQTHATGLVFPKGTYDFFPDKAPSKHYYITNHDHVDQRAVAMPLEGLHNFTLDGQGSSFIFHGVMMPIAIVSSTGLTLENFSIDDAHQHFLLSRIVANDKNTITVQVLPGQNFTVQAGQLILSVDGWTKQATATTEFDPATMTLVLGGHDDYGFGRKTIKQTGPNTLQIPAGNSVGKIGDIMLFRGNDRPNPAIWSSESKDLTVSHVNVHAAQGMAFVAQKTENVHLDALDVTLTPNTPRIVSTNADALHFANCRGELLIESGVYENMLDDGINVHSVVLRVAEVKAPNSVLFEWGHFQTFGWTFASVGEHVEFLSTKTLLPDALLTVTAVQPIDEKHFILTFSQPVPSSVKVDDIADNTEWRPSVVYRNNTVRRTRSRGVLFSTPEGVLIEGNHFDKTTGAAILLPGEAGKWFEGVPSSDVIIRHNTISNANLAKPTAAPITIGPSIAKPGDAEGYNHRRILIEDNDFNLMGRHLVQGLSIDGIVFSGNKLGPSPIYPNIPNDTTPILTFTHVRCVHVGANTLGFKFTAKDIDGQDMKLVNIDGVTSPDDAAAWNAACANVTKE